MFMKFFKAATEKKRLLECVVGTVLTVSVTSKTELNCLKDILWLKTESHDPQNIGKKNFPLHTFFS